MTSNLKKRLHALAPIGIILAGLILAGGSGFALYRLNTQPTQTTSDSNAGQQEFQVESSAETYEEASSTSDASTTEATDATFVSIPKTETDTAENQTQNQENTTTSTQATPVPTTNSQQNQTTDTTQQSIPTPSPAAPAQPQLIPVAVTIDGAGSFNLELEQGKNHCDVLTTALGQGKISSLNMQYNPSLSSYGVYQINGLGSDSQVWWAYKVNDTSPPLGCSQIQVNAHDQIQWQYVGP